jgi:predicted acyl esterase
MRPAITPSLLLTLALSSVAFGQLVQKDTTFQMDDGVNIDATFFRPSGSPPDSGFPGVVLVHGLGGSKRDMFNIAQILGWKGYVALAYSVRGQGGSGGVRTFDGERERQDLRSLIAWLGSRSYVNPRRLAVVGGSQGGQHAWWAAMFGLGVRTIVAVAGFVGDLSSNGCIETAVLDVLSSSRVRYDATWSKVRAWVLADNLDSLQAVMPNRDDLVRDIRIPVMLSFAYRDWLFAVNEGLRQFDLLPGPKLLHLGTGYHGAPSSNEVESALYVLALNWVDRWLKGVAALPIPQVAYHIDGTWELREASRWPPEDVRWETFYLSPDGKLARRPPSSATRFILGQRLLDGSYTAERAAADGFGPSTVSKFRLDVLEFLSDPFLKRTEWAGSPECRFHLRWGPQKGQLHVQVYDVDPSGTWHFLQRGNIALRWGRRDTLVHFRCQAYAHEFAEGHRVGIRLTPIDFVEEEGRCYVIPFFNDFEDTLLAEAESPLEILFPLRGGEPVGVAQRAEARQLPIQFELGPPRPNPFNSAVSAELRLRAKSFVAARILDLRGRVIKELVAREYPPGAHLLRWDGLDQAGQPAPSGVYLLSVQVGKGSVTSKLCLVR